VQTLSRLERQPLDQMGIARRSCAGASGAEALAALRAAASQQASAAFGGHTRPKTMGSGTM
jgi:hypothetical protein